MRVGIHADPAAHRIPGGIGVYVRHLVTELLATDEGGDYRLILSAKSKAPAVWDEARIVRTNLPVGPQYVLWNYLGIPKIRDSLDVVHATGLAIPPANGAALVATIHDLAVDRMPAVVPLPWRAIYRRGLHSALENAAVICTVSEAVKRELIEGYGADEQRILVTGEGPNASPQDARDEDILKRIGPDQLYLLNVGTVEPRKNQAGLLRAFARAGPDLKDMKVVIAGSLGWGHGDLTEEIDRLGLEGRVVLTGEVSVSELATLYSKAYAFAFPSLYEGFGIPLLEALSFGIPSVASSTPALKEVGGSAATYVDANDTEGLSEALRRLVRDAELRSVLSAAGPAQAGKFSWKSTAESTVAAYRQAAGVSGPQA